MEAIMFLLIILVAFSPLIIGSTFLGWQKKIKVKHNESRILKHCFVGYSWTYFFFGFFATLMATPCSAPFVGTAISFAFTQQSILLLLIFFFMGFGMSLPYLMIATFPAMISFIPIIIFYTLLQRYFVRGITGSAVKE